jgi:hypothetical protein
VFYVAVDEVNFSAFFCDVCAQDGPEGPGAVNGCSHGLGLLALICLIVNVLLIILGAFCAEDFP